MTKSLGELTEELILICELGRDQPNRFLTVPDILNQYSELILYEDELDNEVNMVHYTTWKNALYMFESSPNLRMYSYEQSNDPVEGKIVPPEWREIEENANWLEQFLEPWQIEEMKSGGTSYGCSFSSGSNGVEDDSAYWRLYGNDGQGCSLKITLQSDIQFYRVRYRDKDFNERTCEQKDEDEQVADQLKKLFKVGKELVDGLPDEYKSSIGEQVALKLSRAMYGYYHLIKDIAYEKEEEWRMIEVWPKLDEVKFDTSSDFLVKRYIEGPSLNKLLASNAVITVGPTVPNRRAARAYIKHLATAKHDIDNTVEIKISDKHYRQKLPSKSEIM